MSPCSHTLTLGCTSKVMLCTPITHEADHMHSHAPLHHETRAPPLFASCLRPCKGMLNGGSRRPRPLEQNELQLPVALQGACPSTSVVWHSFAHASEKYLYCRAELQFIVKHMRGLTISCYRLHVATTTPLPHPCHTS